MSNQPPISRRPSSSSQPGRPPSSAGSSRPSSSLSGPSRPSSSLSVTRPLSRVSHGRPPSSMTYRPPSAAGPSYRPASRIARPPSRAAQRNKLLPLYQALVSQVTGLKPGEEDEEGDEDRARHLVEHVARQLESTTMNKASASQDMTTVDQIISGYTLKARVNLQDTLSKSLEHCYGKLKKQVDGQESDLDSDVKANKLPDHLQLLVALSQPPSAPTLAFADLYLENVKNPPPGPQPLTWKQILAEDPFEGDHWEGILDPINIDNWDSTPSLSPLNSDDLALDDDDSDDSYYKRGNEAVPEAGSPSPRSPKVEVLPHPREDASLFEELEKKQYWREEWQTDADTDSAFDLGDPSTLGPSLNRVAEKARAARYGAGPAVHERHIDEEDMVRELLMALQGRENVALFYVDNRYGPTLSTPRLIHLSPESQTSILNTFANTATTLRALRSFTEAVFSNSWSSPGRGSDSPSLSHPSNSSLTRTSEAFADAVDQEVRNFDAWCASREEDICRACQGLTEPLVVSLLETQNAISDEYGDAFDVLLGTIESIFHITTASSDGEPDPIVVVQTRRSPAAHSTLLLDTLFSALLTQTERNSLTTSQMLLRIFIRAAEPIWGMLTSWLRDGMSVVESGYGDKGRTEKKCDLEEEFFIESSGVGIGIMSMGLMDPDFWKEGYCLRDIYVRAPGESTMGEVKKTLVPEFLKHVAETVLETGKAVGLVRALGLTLESEKGLWKLPRFREVISASLSSEGGYNANESNPDWMGRDVNLTSLFGVSVDSLSRVVYDRLSPVCEATGGELVKIVVDDCELWRHVNAIEDMFLMRKGDALTHFIDLVFAKIDVNLPWADFHFLNTAFSDVVRTSQQANPDHDWIQLPLVRLSHRNHRDAARLIHRTVRAFEGLQIEYAVPFPLTYIFRPDVMQRCSEVFVLLTQIRRAKGVLERILVRSSGEGHGYREEMKLFYAMRSRLSWFVNTLLTFLTTYVIHVEIQKFHEKLSAARSLDEITKFHDQHVEHIQSRCLLTDNTEALHKAIISVLDMCLHFSGMFTSYAGDTTAMHDVSRQSITLKHRSRRLKRQQRNVIGFSSGTAPPSASFRDIDSSDDDYDEDNESTGPPETSFSVANDTGYGEDTLGGMEQMSKELDGLVRFVRRGVESLSGGAGEEAATFGILAFALEDWDL